MVRVQPVIGLLLVLVLGFTSPGAIAQTPDQTPCLALTARDEPLPVGTGPCPGVRPGANLYSPNMGWYCTMNFLFQGSDGHRYIGTAGHCLRATTGETVYEDPLPEAHSASGKLIGHFVYASMDYEQAYRDFALVRLLPKIKASPKMCHFGGPVGMYRERSSDPVILHMYGNGLVVGSAVPARSGVALDTLDRDVIRARLPVTTGDSGSGVMDEEGRAAGVEVAIDLLGGETIITRLAPQLARAENALGLRLRLQTARF